MICSPIQIQQERSYQEPLHQTADHLFEVFDHDLIVKYDGLGVLNVPQGGYIKHHAAHVIGVATDLC